MYLFFFLITALNTQLVCKTCGNNADGDMKIELFLVLRLQAPVSPAFSMMGSMIGDAFALAVVGYGIAISLGRIFALKYGYKVDSNQVRQTLK